MPEKKPPSILGFALFFYVFAVVLVITLMPFRFELPRRFSIFLGGTLVDSLTNILLFVPLGFLYRQAHAGAGNRWCWDVLLLGLLVSGFIELAQLFQSGRYSSPYDVLTNGFGAWSGGWLYLRAKEYLNDKLVGQLALELPLMNLFYLLTPLLWLNGLTAGEPLYSVPILGAFGCGLLTAIWVNRLKPAGVLSANQFACVVGAWFILASLPTLVKHPKFTVACSIFLAGLSRTPLWQKWLLVCEGRRFELPTLLRLWPIYAIYLILLVWHPLTWLSANWQFSLGFAEFDDIPGIHPILGLVAYFAAFTLLGYMVAESLGRNPASLRRIFRQVSLSCLVWAGALEFMRGCHPQHIASLARFGMAFGASLYGALLYRLQLVTIQEMLTKHKDTIENKKGQSTPKKADSSLFPEEPPNASTR